MKLFVVICLIAVTVSAEVQFSEKPKVKKSGEEVKISFTVTENTDVEVAIVNAKGDVIKHLAAGVLGANAPSPLQKDSLSQSLVWDGKADWGKDAAGGPFTARVSLGMKPLYNKLIGETKGDFAGVSSFICDKNNGDIYMFSTDGNLHPGDGHCSIVAYNKEGKYLHTVFPWTHSLPAEKLQGLKRVKLADGSTVPFFYQAETRSLISGIGQLSMTGGLLVGKKLVFSGHQEIVGTTTRYNQIGKKVVTCVNSDGSMPEDGILRTVLAKRSRCTPMLAVASDGKTFYAADVYEGESKKPYNQHAVYRFTLNDEKAEAWLGNEKIAGSGATGFNRPRDVAVDGKGNVYIADYNNNRIAIFSAAGKYIKEIPVEMPRRLEIDTKTGAIYLLSASEDAKGDNYLYKFASLDADTFAYKKKIFVMRYRGDSGMALDNSGSKPVIWISSGRGLYSIPKFQAMRIVDEGDSFGKGERLRKRPGFVNPKGVGAVRLLSYNDVTKKLIINTREYDPATGEIAKGIKNDGRKSGMGSVGMDGNTYLVYYPAILKRFDENYKPLPFAGKEKGVLKSHLKGSIRLRTRGVTADPLGNIYALWQSDQKKDGSGRPANKLVKYDKDGNLLTDTLIDSTYRSISSPRLDAQGNIYLSIGARPVGKRHPDEIAGQDLGIPWKSQKGGLNASDIDWYHLLYGAILKFPPTGGSILPAGSGGMAVEYNYGKVKEIKGSEFIYYGTSPVVSWRYKYPDTCSCESSRFDVDGWGRSYFPDVARFKVGIIDTAGNLICRFGDYGNIDDEGEVGGVYIPLMWADEIEYGDGVVYCGDRYNNRVVAVDIKYIAQESCVIK